MKRTLISAAVIVGISSFSFAQDNSGRAREDQMKEQPGRIIIKSDDEATTGTGTAGTRTEIRTERDTTTGTGTTGTRTQTDSTATGTLRTDRNATGGAAMQAGARATAQIDTNETIKHLNSANELEIQLSQHVQQSGQDAQVKQLAGQMVRDHQNAKQQLQQLAQKKNVTLDAKLMPMHQAKLDHFKKKSGAELDAMYSFDQAGHHVKDVLEHQYISAHAQDQDLRQFAQTALPTLQQHLQQVTSIAQGFAGAEGSAMPASGRMEGQMNNSSGVNRSSTEINRSTEIRGSGSTSGTGASGSVGTSGTTGTGSYDSNVAGPRDQAGTQHDAGAGTTGNRTGAPGAAPSAAPSDNNR